MPSWEITLNGGLTKVYESTDLVGYLDDWESDESEECGLLCVFCADAAYGAVISELSPVRVGELLGSDTPNPDTWLCVECEQNVLTYH